MVNWAKNARINSSEYSPANGRLRIQVALVASGREAERRTGITELPDHSPEFGRRMLWLWAARRAFESMDTSHRLRRALLTGVQASSHDISTKEEALFEKHAMETFREKNPWSTNLVDHLIQRCLTSRQNRLLLKGSPVSEAPIDGSPERLNVISCDVA